MSPGRSGSVALTVNASCVLSATVWALTATTDGALLLTVTVTLNVVCAVAPPVSATRIVTACVPTSATPGIQLKIPVTGSSVAPPIGVTNVNVSVLAGRSTSVADAVNVSSVPRLMDCAAMGAIDGGVLLSATVIVNDVSALADAPSTTRTVTG